MITNYLSLDDILNKTISLSEAIIEVKNKFPDYIKSKLPFI